MDTRLTQMVGCDYPLVAFSHCRDVVAAVTNSGGFGVFGASRYQPDELEAELAWLDERTNGRNYGIDLILPTQFGDNGTVGDGPLPSAHTAFVDDLMRRYDVPVLPESERHNVTVRQNNSATLIDRANELWDVAAAHSIKMFVSALGPPSEHLVDAARDKGAVVGALVGSVRHAQHQQAAGVDFVVAQGSEAGGHCGEVSTMVLTPDVVDAMGVLPVLAAGGIASGRQMAAALALGAAGVWTGSVWLATHEAETNPVVLDKFLLARAEDAIRSCSTTGKPARQLRSAWTDEWDNDHSPQPLGMPFQTMLTAEAKVRIDRAAHYNPGAAKLVNYFVGQVVGRMNTVRSARQVVEEMITEYVEVMDRFDTINK